MHHYLGLISNDGNWSSILTISGKEPSALTEDGQLPQTCLRSLHNREAEAKALAEAALTSFWQHLSHICHCPRDANKS